jgi:hypothetical protein
MSVNKIVVLVAIAVVIGVVIGIMFAGIGDCCDLGTTR